MGKFEVGDRVRRTVRCDKPNLWGKVGCVYTVERTDGWGGIGLSGLDEEAFACGDEFELVQPAATSPVRTVTRREIVPGGYGCVEISRSGMVKTSGWIDGASTIREAARIFNEIADVLDEHEAEAKEAA
jgi:hypothetical protein